jgi:hypothetical protein
MIQNEFPFIRNVGFEAQSLLSAVVSFCLQPEGFLGTPQYRVNLSALSHREPAVCNDATARIEHCNVHDLKMQFDGIPAENARHLQC